jgi:hypothetical protein
MVSGGDGAYCFFDKIDPSLSITSIYYNQYYVFVDGNYQNSLNNWSSGTFVSPADLDYNKKILFCNAVDYAGNHANQILRLSDLTGSGTGSYLTLNTASTVFFSALKYSPYSPAGKSTIFIGTESGRLFKVREAHSNSPVLTEIGSVNFPTANLSSIAIGKSEDSLMVTFSNYGVSSVWQTNNGGQTWQDIEGNLPDMPVRWALYHPGNTHQALLATETGVWECVSLYQNPVQWVPVNTGMANVRVDMLQMRESDNTVLAATHGRGLFTMIWDVSTGGTEKLSKAGSVYPNPTSGKIQVSASLDQSGTVNLAVSDLQGKQVCDETLTVPAGYFNKLINLDGQPKGTYVVTLKNKSRTLISQKVIVY